MRSPFFKVAAKVWFFRGGPAAATAVLLAAIVFGWASSLSLARTSPPETAKTTTETKTRDDRVADAEGVVLRVVDGDTLIIRRDGEPPGAKTTVRLIGVDTPETVHPSKPIERYGKEAAAFLKREVEGKEVRLLTDAGTASKDRYGRDLLYVRRVPDGWFANLEIIRQGYGHAYTRFPFGLMTEFRRAEIEAKTAKRGLWADPASPPSPGPAPDPKSKPGPKPKDGPDAAKPDAIVWIARTGSRYHREACPTLKSVKTPVRLADAVARRLSPCASCKPPNPP